MKSTHRALILAAFAAGIIPGAPEPKYSAKAIPAGKQRNTGAAKQKRAAKKRKNK